MLNLLRKYQKGIFIVTSVIVVLSFSFFGTYNAISQVSSTPVKEKDTIIGTSIDGGKISKLQMEKMARFLSSDAMTPNKDKMPNIFNDGVIATDILESGLGFVIGKNYFEFIENEMAVKFNRFKTFKPYTHPSASFISAETVWEKFVPQIHEKYQAFMQAPMDDPIKLLEKTIDLYLVQRYLPGQAMRQLLTYMQNQYGFVEKDPYLDFGDLNIFHAASFEDWFGHNYLQIVSQFIYNGAQHAKENGFEVTKNEAKASLLKNGKEALQGAKEDLSEQELLGYFHQYLQSNGLTEDDAISIWQNVLLFRRLMNHSQEAIFIDPLMYQDFVEYASNEASITLYSLPKEFVFNSDDQMYAFEEYKKAISCTDTWKMNDLLEQIKSEDQILKEQLVTAKVMNAKIAHATLNDIKLNVAVKDLWSYETTDEYWNHLSKSYPELAKVDSYSERLAALEKLSPMVREKIDDEAKTAFVRSQPTIISEFLHSLPKKDEMILLPYQGIPKEFRGAQSSQEVLSLLNNDKKERQLSFNDEYFYLVSEVEFANDKILTFEECKNYGVADQLVERRLTSAFQSQKNTNPEMKELGYEKSKERLKKSVYKLSLEKIKVALKNVSSVYLKDCQNYYQLCFIDFMQSYKNNMEVNLDSPLLKQFALTKKEYKLNRSNFEPLPDDQFFRMKENELSDLFLVHDSELAFFKLGEHRINPDAIEDEINKGRSIMLKEAKQQFANAFIKDLKAKHAINVPEYKGLLADDS